MQYKPKGINSIFTIEQLGTRSYTNPISTQKQKYGSRIFNSCRIKGHTNFTSRIGQKHISPIFVMVFFAYPAKALSCSDISLISFTIVLNVSILLLFSRMVSETEETASLLLAIFSLTSESLLVTSSPLLATL